MMDKIIGRLMGRGDVWENQELKRRLNHYYKLLQEDLPQNAFYLICKSIPSEIKKCQESKSTVSSANFESSHSFNKLWDEHQRLKRYFEENLVELVDKSLNPKEFPEYSFLDLKIDIVDKMLECCNFCERNCQINRKEGKKGYCGIGGTSYYSSAFLHHGEEAPLVPSGTIFFTGCNLGCIFCQNDDLSAAGKEFDLAQSGTRIDPERLAQVATRLSDRDALNINYVGGDPTPNIHTILKSMKFQEQNVCQLWNSNFYNSIDVLKLLSDVMDVWLPDFKYGNNECAQKYSGVPDYWDILRRNFRYINTHGSKNIIIRHLIMPNHIECCSKPILKWLAENMKDHVVVNLMGQYRPEYKVNRKDYPEINRRPSKDEIDSAFTYAQKLGLEYQSVS